MKHGDDVDDDDDDDRSLATISGISNEPVTPSNDVYDEIAQSVRLVEMVASNEWNNCGFLFYQQNNYIKALKCFNEKLKLLCNRSTNLRVSTVLNSEFIYYNNKGNYSQVLQKARTMDMLPEFSALPLTTDVCTTLHW